MKPRPKPDTALRPSLIGPTLTGIALLAGALFSSAACATGFGEIILHSRISESLLAEVPLIGGGKELADASCFSLIPHPGSDLPVITNARIRLINNNNNYRLLIVGNKAIAEPVFTISLRASCGLDLRHDYILMPDAPAPLAQMLENAAPGQGHYRDEPAATSERTQQAKKPDRQAAPSRPARKAVRQRPGDNPPPRPVAQETSAVGQASRITRETNGDRLILSAAPLTLKTGEMAVPPGRDDMEERVLKMETSLRAMNEEMDTLNTSLTLTTEMLSARHELQTAQTLQPPAITAAVPTPAPITRESSAGNWLELALSSLIGGSLAVGLAAFLGRRRRTAPARI